MDYELFCEGRSYLWRPGTSVAACSLVNPALMTLIDASSPALLISGNTMQRICRRRTDDSCSKGRMNSETAPG